MKVRAGSKYVFNAVGMDTFDPPYGVRQNILKNGQTVKVVNLPGCPKANSMGMCHIEDPETREFLGLVLCNSLEHVSTRTR
jgi:hypothetical protein